MEPLQTLQTQTLSGMQHGGRGVAESARLYGDAVAGPYGFGESEDLDKRALTRVAAPPLLILAPVDVVP